MDIKKKLTEDFFISLKKGYTSYERDKTNKNLFELNRKMEVLFGQNIMGKVSKSDFLQTLYVQCSEHKMIGLFDHVIEHLFTPIAWTTSQVIEGYALQNYINRKFVVVRLRNDSTTRPEIILELSKNPFPLLTFCDHNEVKDVLEDMIFTNDLGGIPLPSFISCRIHEKCSNELFPGIEIEHVHLAQDLKPSTLNIVSTRTIFSK